MSTTLADLRMRALRLEWYEAVAIVRELCERCLDAAGNHEPQVPDLRDIVLAPDGTLSLRGKGTPGQNPTERAAVILGSLVPERDLPVKLRLVLVTALSPPSPYGSLVDFHRALEYFERPDRTAQLRAVYVRWAASPPLQEAPPPADLSALRAEPRARAAPAARRPLWKRRWVWAVAAGVVLGVAVALAWWWVTRPGRPLLVASQADRLKTAVSQTTAAVTTAVTAGVTAVGTRMGLLTPPAPAETTKAPEPAAKGKARRASPQASRTPSAEAVAGTGGGSRGEPTAPAAEVTPTGARPVLDADVRPDRVDAVTPEPPDVIYSAENPEVAPPVLLRPQLPSLPPPGTAVADLPVMELVVSGTGDVLFAKLRTRPRGVHDAMLVSAAKAWVFQPASRQDQAVTYRVFVVITLQ